ncbi:MAG: DNA translocase FtsK [Lachnospiraceae bacterium]|nr:DNA translocase FtsK [Lachnospiraceae bacterium]
MASNVTGKTMAQKKSSSAVNRKKSADSKKRADSGYSADKRKRTEKKNSTAGKSGSVETNNTVNDGRKYPISEEGNHKNIIDEIRFLVAVGITILVTMCNFHYCMGVGNAVYFILHGLFGCLAYVLPFVLLGAYLFMIPNRGNREAWMKTRLCLLLFLECCFLFHFIGIKETQPFSPVYYFLAGQSGINGGLAGGLVSGLLQHLIGTMATILIIFLMMLITVIIFTERSAVRTLQTWAGAVHSLTGGRFQRMREIMQEWFSDDEEDYNYYDEDEYEYESDDYEREDSGRHFTWNRKAVGMAEKTSEFFTQKFPFMNEKAKDSPEPVSEEDSGYTFGSSQAGSRESDNYGAGNDEKADKDRRWDEKNVQDTHADRSLFDENWRRGFSSSGKETDIAGTQQEKSGSWQSRNGAGQIKTEVRTGQIKTEVRAGSLHDVSGDGRPGSPSGRIFLQRDTRSLEEMGFGDLLREEEPAVTGSIDDFIVYNGVSSAEKWTETRNDTYPLEEDADPVSEMECMSVEDTGRRPEVRPEEVCEPEEDIGWESGERPEEEYASAEDTDPVPEMEVWLPEQPEAEETGERAIDLTEHVVLPEDGPIVRNAPEAAGSGLIPSSGISNRGSVSGSIAEKSSAGIWKQDSDTGSRGSSGAVTFSSRPKDPEKKPVKKRPYRYPSSSLLKRNTASNGKITSSNDVIKEKLHETLQNFGVNVKMGEVSVGPAVTRYELEPEPGVKVSRIVALQDDIKLALAAPDIRIEAPIPGKSAIGIEVPNRENTVVGFRELIESEAFQKHPSKVAVAVGRDISGQIVVADLAKMPHLLIAGATGSGKSVCINTLIMSIIYKASPEEVKLVMVDPKVVELSIYNGIPHLLVPVVTDARKAANALRWAVEEMNDRYKKFAEYNVRNIEGYNEHLKKEKEKDPSNEEAYLYQMVIIVDELADLMMVAQGEVEEAICRLAQMARAAGIHLVLATQRPSVNVITGLIKANVPSRIAFAVSSGVDSRTIIDMNGAEKLLGKGDMLFYPYGIPKPVRVQGAFISDEEVSEVVSWLHKNNGGVSGQEMMEKMITSASENAAMKTERDAYFESAGRFIIEKDKASIGALQRNFKIGFNRAARIMDQLAAAGVVGEEDGTKPRTILMNMDEFNQFLDAD